MRILNINKMLLQKFHDFCRVRYAIVNTPYLSLKN